jgi:hypothetical protein
MGRVKKDISFFLFLTGTFGFAEEDRSVVGKEKNK